MNTPFLNVGLRPIVPLFVILMILMIGLIVVPEAQAAAYVITNPGGGDCASIGSWDAGSSTCTLNRDITVSGVTAIEMSGDNLVLDGAGHTITGNDTLSTYGVNLVSQDNDKVENLTVKDFDIGIRLFGTNSSLVSGNKVSGCTYGIDMTSSTGVLAANTASFNILQSNSTHGLHISSTSDNNLVGYNDFINNGLPQAKAEAGSTGSFFTINYWSSYDSPSEGCDNGVFDLYCDGAYAPATSNISDANPVVLKSAWGRFDWTWYDNAGGDDWLLMADRPDPATTDGFVFDLTIAGVTRDLGAFPGAGPGFVRPGQTIYNRYAGVSGGPVTAGARLMGSSKAVTSQRVLWPAGGDSLEEVPGTSVLKLDSRLFWTWYDMASPGYKDWILVSNPNDFQIHYAVKIAGSVMDVGVLAPGGRITPSFPGVIGGPVEVYAWDDSGSPAYVMASQRVLSNGDAAFNEVPGISRKSLSSDYVWPWYDMTGDNRNWVLIANPPTTHTGAVSVPIYYDVWIAGTHVASGGPIAVGGNVTPWFPGSIGGPVQVKTFSDAGHTLAADSIVSQRVVWGPSFEEAPGAVTTGGLKSTYDWTWYDQKSPGAQNWVLVATKPDETNSVTVEVSFVDQDTGITQFQTHDISTAEKRWTPTFDGKMGGPVHVKAYRTGFPGTAKNVIASQRVLWNGYFNEVWGQ